MASKTSYLGRQILDVFLHLMAIHMTVQSSSRNELIISGYIVASAGLLYAIDRQSHVYCVCLQNPTYSRPEQATIGNHHCEIERSRIELHETIGSGAYGEVYRATVSGGIVSGEVAVKAMKGKAYFTTLTIIISMSYLDLFMDWLIRLLVQYYRYSGCFCSYNASSVVFLPFSKYSNSTIFATNTLKTKIICRYRK